jgi:hypothetical protein
MLALPMAVAPAALPPPPSGASPERASPEGASPEDVRPERASPERARREQVRPEQARRWLLLAAAVACAGYLATELWALRGGLGLPLDDSWIHLQFARNLAAGRGLSYNPGELVTGSTAPLWTALLSLLAYLPGNPLAWVQLLGCLLYLGAVDATWRLARELGLAPALAALATTLTLATGWMVWSAMSGMEVPLFTLLSLWGMILHLRERAADRSGSGGLPLAPAVLAVAAVARPEGLLLLVLALLDRCLLFTRDAAADAAAGGRPGVSLRWRRPPFARLAAGGLLAVCALAGPVLFYRLAGGSFLPTTYAAKGGQMRQWLPDLKYVYNMLGMFLRSQPYMTLLAGGGVAQLVARLGSRRDRGLLPGLWLVALPLVYSMMSPPGARLLIGNFGRYYFPFFPVVAVLGTLAIEGAADALRPGVWAGGRRPRRLPAAFLLAALMLWPTASELVDRAAFYAHNLTDVESSDVTAARWLAPRLPAGALLAVIDIGAFKYFLPNRIVDLAGIANPDLRREVRRAVAGGVPFERAMAAAVARRRPDYVVIFPEWLPHLAAELALRPVLTLRLRGNVTMGSDELAVYATPWNRYPLRRLPGDPG